MLTHFTKINFTSTDIETFGGHKTGDTRLYYNTEFGCMQYYVLVKVDTGQTIGDGHVCKLKTGQTTTGRTTEIVVLQNAANTTPGFCVNQSGGDLVGPLYCWMLTGFCVGYGLGGTIGDGVQFTGGAAGIIAPVADGLDCVLGISISDVTTTTANKVFWRLPGFGVFDLA